MLDRLRRIVETKNSGVPVLLNSDEGLQLRMMLPSAERGCGGLTLRVLWFTRVGIPIV